MDIILEFNFSKGDIEINNVNITEIERNIDETFSPGEGWN